MVVRRGEILMPMDRNPLEIGLLAWAAITGGGRLIALHAGDPSVPPTGIPEWGDIAWHLLLLLGSAAALVGAYWPDAITGVLIVRAAMWPLSAGATVYAVGLGLAGQWRPALAVALFAGVFAWRAAQIGSHLRDHHILERRRA